ncbi:MAG: holo-[acyl-carrier-protein] synthase [Verrucomicrobia bacterium]|nr:MAG: holo-[acyl-carrier-protein] synthase [Verrucomicrobiota bacterium]
MSVIGIGVDLIECSRIQHSMERFGDRFLNRVFTDGEIAYSMSMKFPERHLAARFAGKEAVAKAFGTGIGKAMGWRNIDIRKKESGEPFLFFSGPAEAFAAERGVTSALITLSHTEHHAIACVVLEGTASANCSQKEIHVARKTKPRTNNPNQVLPGPTRARAQWSADRHSPLSDRIVVGGRFRIEHRRRFDLHEWQ